MHVQRFWRYARGLAACCPQRKAYCKAITMCIYTAFGVALRRVSAPARSISCGTKVCMYIVFGVARKGFSTCMDCARFSCPRVVYCSVQKCASITPLVMRAAGLRAEMLYCNVARRWFYISARAVFRAVATLCIIESWGGFITSFRP